MSAGQSSKVDLGRAKSVGEIIGDALRCYAAYPVLFATLTLAVVVPYAVIVGLIEQANLIGGTRHGAVAAFVLILIDVLLVGPLISALHVHAVVELGAQRVPKVREVFTRGVRVLPVVAAAQVVAGGAHRRRRCRDDHPLIRRADERDALLRPPRPRGSRSAFRVR